MSDPKPVVRCGGLRAILVALTDNLQDLSDALLKVFLYLLESPETRCYVRQGLDSEVWILHVEKLFATDNFKQKGWI